MPDLELITRTGAFGVIAVLLWLQWDKDRRFTRLVSNHMEHDMTSRDANTVALTKMADAISSLEKTIERR